MKSTDYLLFLTTCLILNFCICYSKDENNLLQFPALLGKFQKIRLRNVMGPEDMLTITIQSHDIILEEFHTSSNRTELLQSGHYFSLLTNLSTIKTILMKFNRKSRGKEVVIYNNRHNLRKVIYRSPIQLLENPKINMSQNSKCKKGYGNIYTLKCTISNIFGNVFPLFETNIKSSSNISTQIEILIDGSHRRTWEFYVVNSEINEEITCKYKKLKKTIKLKKNTLPKIVKVNRVTHPSYLSATVGDIFKCEVIDGQPVNTEFSWTMSLVENGHVVPSTFYSTSHSERISTVNITYSPEWNLVRLTCHTTTSNCTDSTSNQQTITFMRRPHIYPEEENKRRVFKIATFILRQIEMKNQEMNDQKQKLKELQKLIQSQKFSPSPKTIESTKQPTATDTSFDYTDSPSTEITKTNTRWNTIDCVIRFSTRKQRHDWRYDWYSSQKHIS